MKTELDIYIKILGEFNYSYFSVGDGLPNPLQMELGIAESMTFGYPDTIILHYNYETGNVFNVGFKSMGRTLPSDMDDINEKIKIELRNHNIDKLL
tara:strand:- start:747 stop:1034 length:288 start_codon:yes stop_codon:yes gene_type:complete